MSEGFGVFSYLASYNHNKLRQAEMRLFAKLEPFYQPIIEELARCLWPFIKTVFYLLSKQPKLDKTYRTSLANLIKRYHQHNVAH